MIWAPSRAAPGMAGRPISRMAAAGRGRGRARTFVGREEFERDGDEVADLRKGARLRPEIHRLRRQRHRPREQIKTLQACTTADPKVRHRNRKCSKSSDLLIAGLRQQRHREIISPAGKAK